MKKQIIAIDCDDVIVASAPAILDHYNKTYGTDIAIEDFYGEELAAYPATERVDEYLASEEYKNLPPLQEAIHAIRQLGEHHELHVVTGRADYLAEATHTMLKKHFPDIFRSVEFTNYFGKNSRSKAQVCKDIGADLLIDDHLHHAEVVAAEGIEVLLFGDYPWNKADTLPPNITRVRGWNDIVERLLPVNTPSQKI
jgi:5'(3')-deoxyribonucleotidase